MRFASVLCLGLIFSGSAAAAERPNILLVMTDDQGYWDVGNTGNPHIDTPVMNRLAAEGVQFDRFYVAPVCAPTRAGVMTGRYALRTGLYNTRFGGDTLGIDEVTVAQLLKRAGYRTGLFGKWHLGRYADYQPHHRGFDQFFGHYHGHIEHYDGAEQLVHNGRSVTSRGYVTDLFTDAAIEFIRAEADEPFFCMVAFNAPHSPHLLDTTHYGQPKGDKLISKYLTRGLPLREARIYAMVDRIDQNLGRLLLTLDQHECSENTVVVFMSDNGGVSRHFKAGLRGLKAQVFEGGVRSPLFVRWPKHFPAGGRVQAQTSHVDLLPTFCELAGAALPKERLIDGKSLLPLLRAGRGDDHHEYVYHTWDRYTPNPDRRWGISSKRYKLLCNLGTDARPNPRAWQLFDLQEDPGERQNIAGKNPERVQQLRAEFLRWFHDVTRGQKYKPIPIPVGHANENPVEVEPSWAALHGENIHYTFEGYDWDTIDAWREPGERADWNLQVLNAGRYELVITYGSAGSDAGGMVKFAVGDSSVDYEPESTPTSNVFITRRVGTLDLTQGAATLSATVVRSPGQQLMSLNAITLRRLSDVPVSR